MIYQKRKTPETSSRLIVSIALTVIGLLVGGAISATGCSFVFQPQELTVNYSAITLPESSEKEITVKVVDENNTPVGGAEIYYEQISQDFMYNVGEYWDPGARESGTNTMGIYLDWEWGSLEPDDDVYNWSHLEYMGYSDEQGRLESDAEHIFLRLGVIATSAWIVGEGMDSFTDPGYPHWIDQNNLEQVKTKYLEFVPALLNHLKFKPDFYMLEVEINALGLHTGMTNQEVVDWMDQLTNKIKELDEDAKVSINIGAQDLSPFMDYAREINPELVEQDRYQLPVTDFLERMDRVDYDIITVLMQPFGWSSQGDWDDARGFLESLTRFNKEIYIGWVAFLAEEPVVPDELDPNPNNVNGEGGFVYYPNPGGHSEAWQKEQTLNLMNYIISNPQIIGVHWDILDYVEIGVGGQDFDVKLTSGFTTGYLDKNNEIIEGEKRLVYEPMKELWQSLFYQGSLQTDDKGVVKFNSSAGKYRIIASHPDYKTQEIIIDAR